MVGVATVAVALVGLDPLAWLKKMPLALAANVDIGELTSRVGTLDPPAKISTPSS